MAVTQALKLESTLVFLESSDDSGRYEIFRDIENTDIWGAHIYMLKIVETHSQDMPFNTSLTGQKKTHKMKTWVLLKGIVCEGATSLNEAEEYVRKYHDENWFVLKTSNRAF